MGVTLLESEILFIGDKNEILLGYWTKGGGGGGGGVGGRRLWLAKALDAQSLFFIKEDWICVHDQPYVCMYSFFLIWLTRSSTKFAA